MIPVGQAILLVHKAQLWILGRNHKKGKKIIGIIEEETRTYFQPQKCTSMMLRKVVRNEALQFAIPVNKP